MTVPCIQEHRINQHEISLARLEANTGHIKDRLDNGISATLQDVHKQISEVLVPKVNENSWWVNQIKWAFIWVGVISVGGGFASIVFISMKTFIQ